MKKVIGLICLMFVLVSCGEEKVVENENLVDNNIDVKNKEQEKVENENKIEDEEQQMNIKIEEIKKQDKVIVEKIDNSFIPEIWISLVLPDGYLIYKNGEKNRRGSFLSYDFSNKNLPSLNEIQFFSYDSINTFIKGCNDGICFIGDYPNLERYNNQKEAFIKGDNYDKYKLKNINNRDYFVSNFKCIGDSCVIREYTTFINAIKVDIWITMEDMKQIEIADKLFEKFKIIDEENLILKDFWNWLILKENNNIKYLYLNEKLLLQDSEDTKFEYDSKNSNNKIISLKKFNSEYAIWKEMIIDLRNNKFYDLNYSTIDKVKLWKTGIYFIVFWPNWYSNLRIINNEWEDKSIFMWKPDNWDETIIIYDYELMLYKKIKVFYYHWTGKFKDEKVLDLNEML